MASLFAPISCGLRSRRLLPVCSSGKGFGTPSSSKKGGKKQAPSVDRGDAKAVERAVRLVEDRRARPVDDREAARGRVEFVKVRDWGSGEPTDLGQLQLQAASGVSLDTSAPFYEQLAKRLELLEAQGAMAVAQPKGAKPLPPFKRWAFAEAHYLQYLSDLHSVHSALERALEQGSGLAAGQGQPPPPVPDALRQALQLVGPECGLARSQQIAADIQQLTSSDSGAQESSGASIAASLGLGNEGAGAAAGPTPPSPNAAGLAQLLGSLATRIGAAESEAEARPAVLRLLAHAYVLLLVLLSSGGRVGAAAAEKLNLFARGALNTYRTYPAHVQDPVDQLKGVINQWGELLGEEDREALMEELPGAMQRASLLLTPLAQE